MMTRDRLYVLLAEVQDRLVAGWYWCRRQLRSWWLCRGRHSYDLVFGADRIFLSCSICRRRTPGWDCRLERSTSCR